MAYGGGMGYHLHMPSYFWRTFTEYPCFIQIWHIMCASYGIPLMPYKQPLFISLFPLKHALLWKESIGTLIAFLVFYLFVI